ncbi:histamine H2 receptor-like [Ambystoma mexicanum]|uniref:histamine H2 receptor-like n=1 Tax=Ambystoma mexicanum TaxID=8296 RepID=UPI0037E903D4
MHVSSVLYAVLLVTTCLASVSTNALLLVLFATHLKLRTETWALTLSLTICDMMLGLTIVPAGVYSSCGGGLFTEDTTACRLAAFLFVLLQLASLHSLTWMTIDKFTEICFPLHYAQLFTSHRTWLIIACVWVYCTVQASFPFMGLGYYAYNGNASLCMPSLGSSTKAYSLLLLILGMSTPLMTVCALYIAIVHVAKRQARRGTFMCNEQHCYYVPIRPYFRNTVLLVASAAYLLVCWTPYLTISFMDIFHDEDIPSLVEKISIWLVLLTSVLNPWLNSLGQKKYRTALQETWKKFKQICVHVEQNQLPLQRETHICLRSQLTLPGNTTQTTVHT